MKDLLESYFERIGYTGTPEANLTTLTELHKLHTHAIPFENLTPFLHQEVPLDMTSLKSKLIEQKRGGYCFEQNLLFSEILSKLGFKVKGLGARVLWNQAEENITRRSHMLLSVEIEEQTFIADVGFGGLTLTTPIKFLKDREQETTHEKFKISSLGDDLKLEAQIDNNWKTLYRFDTQTQYLQDYEVANYYLYTHASSPFRNTLIAAKPFEGGRYALSNLQFTTYRKGNDPVKRTLSSIKEILEVLESNFKINLSHIQNLEPRLKGLLTD